MWKPRRILIATDFSRTGTAAAHVAFGLARRMQAEVDLMHAIDPGPQPLTGYAVLDELLGRGGEPEELERAARDALLELDREVGPPDAHLLVRHGPPIRELAAVRREREPELVALGAAGLASLRRFVLGSVADRSLRQPGPPLLLVKDAPRGGEPKNLLVAVEYPDRPTPWLEVALALCHQLRAELTVLHVLPPRGYVSDARHVELDPKSVPDRLEKLVATLDATVPVRVEVKQGDAAAVITRTAKRLESDLVVLGAERGEGGWPGRVADRVARAGLPALLYVWPEPESEEEFGSL